MKKKILLLTLIALSNCVDVHCSNTHSISLLGETTSWKHLHHKLIKEPQRKQLWQKWWPGWEACFSFIPTCASYFYYINADSQTHIYQKQYNNLNQRNIRAISNLEHLELSVPPWWRPTLPMVRAELKRDLWEDKTLFWRNAYYISCFALMLLYVTSKMDVQNHEKKAFLLLVYDWKTGKCKIPTELASLFQEVSMMQQEHPHTFEAKLPKIIKAVKKEILRHVK